MDPSGFVLSVLSEHKKSDSKAASLKEEGG